MKQSSQIRRNRKPAKPAAQTKPAGNDRVRVKVPLSAEEKEAVLAAAKRRGLTPDELLEKAILRQLTPSAQVRLSREGKSAIEKATSKRALTKSQFAEVAIRNELASPATSQQRIPTARAVRRTAKRKPLPKSEITTHGARRLVAGDDQRITIRTKAGSELPGTIQRRDGKLLKIVTGPLEWTEQEFNEALGARRFLITALPELHRLALSQVVSGRERMYEEFLTLLTRLHLAELRDSIPLYWIEHVNPSKLILISLRGEQLPAGSNPTIGKRTRRMLELELRRRNIDPQLCEMLNRLQRICDFASPEALKSLGLFLATLSSQVSKQKSERKERRCKMTAAGKHREAVIPKDWREVASIDFSGYLDRDCEERIIYKTPGGELKAARYSDDKPTVMVIEDVTREQVARWLLECVIPEEFEADFSLGHHVPKRPGATQGRAFSTSAKRSK